MKSSGCVIFITNIIFFFILMALLGSCMNMFDG
jgi:hypothetical protein